jgi:Trypsin-co-occurring domain 2
MPDQNTAIELSSALETLRDELEVAWAQSQGRRVRFQVPHVTLTVQVTARRENKVGGKVRWWLVEGGADHGSARENIQTMVLELSPEFHGEGGEAGPLEVGGDQPEPGD